MWHDVRNVFILVMSQRLRNTTRFHYGDYSDHVTHHSWSVGQGQRLKKIPKDVRPKYRIILWQKAKAVIISEIMVLDLQTVPSWYWTFLFPIPVFLYFLWALSCHSSIVVLAWHMAITIIEVIYQTNQQFTLSCKAISQPWELWVVYLTLVNGVHISRDTVKV